MQREKMQSQLPKELKTKVCRVCLNSHKRMLSLFELHQESSIGSQLTALADVKVSAGDGLPDRICRGCLAELRAALLFRQKCRHSDRQLRGLPRELTEVKKEEPEEYNYEFVDGTWDHEDNTSELNDKIEELVPVNLKQEELNNKVDIYIPPENHVQCHDCGDIFKSKCKLRVHWKSIHKPKSYICEICKRVFKGLRAYNNHKTNKTKSCTAVALEGVQVVGEGKQREFHCSFCDYKTKKVYYMQSHAVTHNGKRPYLCNLCPNSYTQISSLLSHKERAHGEYRVQITCNFCGKHINGRQNAYRHLLQHSEKRYQCDVCKKLLKNKKCLGEHLKRHTGIKQKTCEECGEAFYTMADLCNHRRKHAGLKARKLIPCEICAYKSGSKKVIANHQMKHSSDNFSCVTCGLFFESEHKLGVHVKCHLAEKKYECNLCNARFKQNRHLSRHLKNKHKTPVGNVEVTVKQEPKNQEQFFSMPSDMKDIVVNRI